jgi:hypothetical protein
MIAITGRTNDLVRCIARQQPCDVGDQVSADSSRNERFQLLAGQAKPLEVTMSEPLLRSTATFELLMLVPPTT